MKEKPSWTQKEDFNEAEGLYTMRLVLESPVRSGYWPPSGSNRDRDRLVFSPKPKITGLNWYKPVTVG